MTDRRRPLNLVFLGCGAVTAFHSRTLLAERGRVRCFYASRDLEKAMAFERRFAGGGSYGSYEAALADGRMDAAFVATPPETHLDLTLRALSAGKDVIVEKPALLRAADFEPVLAAQQATGRRVLVAENYAYKPLAVALRGILASGAIGELRFVQLNAVKSQRADGWRARPECGALFEGDVHWIDLAAHLGPPVRAARGFRAGGGSGPERSMLVVLEYEGGAVGTLCHSWEVPSPLRGVQLSRIHGTAGTLLFESNGLFISVRGRRLVFPGLRDLGGYRAMFRELLNALQAGREPVMTLARAQRDSSLWRRRTPLGGER